MSDGATFMNEDARRILENHLRVGPEKPVSYLPINTINRVIGIEVTKYESLISKSGSKSLVFGPEVCCIKSGAVYAYHESSLRNILESNKHILLDNDWPSDPVGFITRMADEWLENESPIMPVIKSAFGDT
nr:hypothetical protein [uncultured Rhodopila sp.]